MSNLHSICNYTYYVIHDKLTFFKNFLKYICIRSAIFSLKEIQHIVQIDFFPDVQLIPGFRHIVEQELQNQRTAKSPPLDLELGKSHGQVDIFYGVRTDKSRIGHRFGKQIAALCIRSRAVMLRAAFSEIFAADVFIAVFSVCTAYITAFVAKKLHFVFLLSGEIGEFIQGFV